MAGMILHSRRPVKLSQFQEEIYQRVMLSRGIPLGRLDFLRLLECSKILDYADGEIYLQQGKRSNSLCLILSGKLEVFQSYPDDSALVKLNEVPSWTLGDAPEWLSPLDAKGKRRKSAVTLACKGPTTLMVWDARQLDTFLEANPQLKVCLVALGARECARILDDCEKYLISQREVREVAAILAEHDKQKLEGHKFRSASGRLRNAGPSSRKLTEKLSLSNLINNTDVVINMSATNRSHTPTSSPQRTARSKEEDPKKSAERTEEETVSHTSTNDSDTEGEHIKRKKESKKKSKSKSPQYH